MPDVQSLVDDADTAALLRAVDGLCAHRQWDALVDLARRCRHAVEVGKQLWPIAMHIDYRLALEAPPAYAAAVLHPGAARFGLGPLTEVAAGGHDWASLAPHIADPASAGAVAQERVIRGEDLTQVTDVLFTELPLVLADWEPSYALPRYRDREAFFPQPEAATRALGTSHLGTSHLGTSRQYKPHVALACDPGAKALREVVEVWVTQSSGRAHTATVEGRAEDAIGRLLHDAGQGPAAAMMRLEPSEALAILQWAGASGGAHGRRRGGARGRFAAWSAATALAGLDWPVDPDALGEALAEMSWFRWAPPGPEAGWVLHLAVEDPVDGLAWAVSATDQHG